MAQRRLRTRWSRWNGWENLLPQRCNRWLGSCPGVSPTHGGAERESNPQLPIAPSVRPAAYALGPAGGDAFLIVNCLDLAKAAIGSMLVAALQWVAVATGLFSCRCRR